MEPLCIAFRFFLLLEFCLFLLIFQADRDMIAIAMQEQLDLHPVLKTCK